MVKLFSFFIYFYSSFNKACCKVFLFRKLRGKEFLQGVFWGLVIYLWYFIAVVFLSFIF